MMAAAHVYLLRCADGSLYCGWTADLDRRLAAHAAGRASRYTRSRLPVALAWSRALPDASAARREEARIKGLPRAGKLALVAGAPPDQRQRSAWSRSKSDLDRCARPVAARTPSDVADAKPGV